MNYANTYQNTYVRLYASDMQFLVNSYAAYLVLSKARSRIAGYFRLANTPTSSFKYKDNGTILIEWHTLIDLVTSAAEAETKGAFQNTKTVTSYSSYFNCNGTFSTSNINCNR